MSLRKFWESLRGSKPVEPPPHFQLRAGTVKFFGPKDGPIEDEFKGKLTTLFTSKRSVVRAYLAVMGHLGSDGAPVVGLCIRFSDDTVHKDVIYDALRVFRSMGFNNSTMLDVMPLDAIHEEQCAAVCAPFYAAAL